MATPSWESEGLSRQRYAFELWSKAGLPPWNWSGILAAETMGATALISCVSGPMIPTTLLSESSLRTDGTESASSHWVSACDRFSVCPRMPPASLIAFCAIWEPWSIAAPRLARLPVKQDSTPIETGPVGCLPPVLGVELVPQAASRSAAATLPDRRRRGVPTMLPSYRRAPGRRLTPRD